MLSALLWFDVGYCEFSDFSHEIEPLSENIVVGLYLPNHHTVRKNEHWRVQEKKVRSSIEAVQSNKKKNVSYQYLVYICPQSNDYSRLCMSQKCEVCVPSK